MSKRVRWIAVLVAIVFLAAGTAQAMPRTEAPGVSKPGGTLDKIVDWLATLLESSSAKKLKGIWGKDGSHLDPNGFS